MNGLCNKKRRPDSGAYFGLGAAGPLADGAGRRLL
jgi:hypothetical protein